MGNFSFKIIPKIIQDRIKVMLPRIIFEEQTGFVTGRNIHANMGLASEFMNEVGVKRYGGNITMKVDI